MSQTRPEYELEPEFTSGQSPNPNLLASTFRFSVFCRNFDLKKHLRKMHGDNNAAAELGELEDEDEPIEVDV